MSTPNLKFEHSPAESLVDSFVSTPGTQYPSLFGTMDPQEAMTPQSFDNDDSMFGGSVRASSIMEDTPAPEKKPVKKRKSWGQQLPEPKTNLPPRKRAKTEDEKEQRRVERVLRNRRAAQSSRERKRQEVEALEAEKRAIERRNQDLEMRLADMEAKFMMAQQQLEQLTGNMAGGNITVFRGSSVASSPRQTDQLRQTSPVTFSQELFTSQDADKRPSISQQSISDLHHSPRTFYRYDTTSCRDVVRPAVSVDRTTALDDFNTSNLPSLTSHGIDGLPHDGFEQYLDLPHAPNSNSHIFDFGVTPTTESFDSKFDHLDGNHGILFEDFNINDFLHQDDLMQSAPEVQSSDSAAQTTALLQPPFGAATYARDKGGNAVSV
ncbi:hypothetical protein BP5796_09526 [Coleophoma crateriformis]|uniref:BZIP domain-containing protein n=1 Tax=Coleophoma crateriformis TaxID=565419 RepID=A0A3D8QYD1_9HELO|nr:hypothetical protein BP5796_09526 [Coleophoma crateriformis]